MTAPIERYVEAIDHARSRNRGLTEQDARAVALSLGMTSDELAEAEQAAADAVTRGLGYLDAGMATEAARELRLASGVRPWDAAIHLSLARALLATGEADDRAEADRIAATVLEHDPASREAIELRRQALQRAGSPATSRPTWAWAGITAICIVGGLIVGLNFRAAPTTPAPVAPAPPPIPAPTPTPVPAPAMADDLPVHLDAPGGEGWTYTPGQARTFWHTDDQGRVQASLTTYGLLRNGAPSGIRKLPVRVEALDAQGTVLFAADGNLHDGSMLRPGDVGRVGVSVLVTLPAPPTAPTASLRLRAHDVERGAPGAAPPTTLVFDGVLPDGGRVMVRARPVERATFQARWPLEVVNTGDSSIASLTFDAVFEDTDGVSVGTAELTVAGTLWPSLEPGEARRVDAMASFPKRAPERVTLRPQR